MSISPENTLTIMRTAIVNGETKDHSKKDGADTPQKREGAIKMSHLRTVSVR